ncbi:hypothetical protein EYF80_004048 [Liparis tanakae]|uniref:Uncharacterized protein n=1 Tax=Liparis tanakae TaxID=230148 RepID=A0A4Z2J783_9TELE|nr:hypothetical protein EYF80_004048 [Liparis tanakae]
MPDRQSETDGREATEYNEAKRVKRHEGSEDDEKDRTKAQTVMCPDIPKILIKPGERAPALQPSCAPSPHTHSGAVGGVFLARLPLARYCAKCDIGNAFTTGCTPCDLLEHFSLPERGCWEEAITPSDILVMRENEYFLDSRMCWMASWTAGSIPWLMLLIRADSFMGIRTIMGKFSPSLANQLLSCPCLVRSLHTLARAG